MLWARVTLYRTLLACILSTKNVFESISQCQNNKHSRMHFFDVKHSRTHLFDVEATNIIFRLLEARWNIKIINSFQDWHDLKSNDMSNFPSNLFQLKYSQKILLTFKFREYISLSSLKILHITFYFFIKSIIINQFFKSSSNLKLSRIDL